MHAATKINTHSRGRLSKLVRYMSRGAVSNKRIEIVEEKSGKRWVKLKPKTAIDVAKCDRCDGTLKPVAAVTCPDGIRSYLTHMDLDPDPPVRDPPRHRQSSFESHLYEHDYLQVPQDTDLPALSYG